MSAGNLLTEWARLLLGALRASGVRDVVLSPGSRNTPFTWAALHDPELRCRSIIDERCAAFFAVGHAKMTGRPVVLVCTSGSAAANYFPAVVEAAESGTPLIVLTADRPLELQHAAAPQTIDQIKLFGDYARAYFELGVPDAHPAMLRAVPRLAAQAVLAARAPIPGPVHINARARKPLEPEASAEADELHADVDRLIDATPAGFAAEAALGPAALEALIDACRAARRGLIVCGPEVPWRAPDPADVAALARATGFPIVAEPASQQRFVAAAADVVRLDAFAALLTAPSFAAALGPDLVLQLGRPPTSSAWGPYLERWPDAARWVIAPVGWPDPWSSATGVVSGAVGPAIRALADALGRERPKARAERAAWRERLGTADAVAREAIEESLADGFSEAAAVRAVIDAVPDGGVLAVGNSLPIREVELFAPAGARGITVWSQRGANGIDGLISGAAGAVTASGRPTTLILGDVSFAHDIGGLAVARDLPAPLAIVVLNNGGGRIFDRLPIAGRLAPDLFDAWLTPPDLDIAAAAEAFGIDYAGAVDAAVIRDVLAEPRTRVVEVRVPPGPGGGDEERLRQRLEAGLGL